MMETLSTTDERIQPLLPVRRLHNFVYCPRLFYFQWVENVFVENADTVAGSSIHRKVDVPTQIKDGLPNALPEGTVFRSLELSSEKMGLVGIIDIAESTENGIELVDYKKGSALRHDNGERVAKEPDAIQLAAHALLLQEHGHTVSSAWVYYAADKRKVEVPLTEELLGQCRQYIGEATEAAKRVTMPDALCGDPRCLYCSLYPVCLPEESSYWKTPGENAPAIQRPPRPDSDEGEVLIVQKPGAQIGVRGENVEVRLKNEKLGGMALHQLKQVYLYGAVQITAQAAQLFLENDIPVAYFSAAGRFLGMLQGLGTSGTDARRGQYRLFEREDIRLHLAKEIIRSKIHNQRVMLMRNGEVEKTDIEEMKRLRNQTENADSLDTLRGLEGSAAALYFRLFASMLKSKGYNFDFNGRNRRPPRDPVNALLSLGYSMLAKELTGICHSVGLDPFIGFFHQPRYGRPALALDLMEEFRPLIADSVAISLLNRHELDEKDFIFSSKGVFLNQQGRRAFWEAYFRRMDTLVSHPQFEYKMPYRRMLEVQARQLWRYLRGEAKTYCGFTTR
ncbi:MAG: CRISPR-associated endonuclease Cas1 [Lentisphaerae bacterium]|nr:CRISPR-associated endonuclease Cas1 [Lentisphaerota bacterium]